MVARSDGRRTLSCEGRLKVPRQWWAPGHAASAEANCGLPGSCCGLGPWHALWWLQCVSSWTGTRRQRPVVGIRWAVYKSTAGGACLKLLSRGGGHGQGSLGWCLALTMPPKPEVASGISKCKHSLGEIGWVCRADHCDRYR